MSNLIHQFTEIKNEFEDSSCSRDLTIDKGDSAPPTNSYSSKDKHIGKMNILGKEPGVPVPSNLQIYLIENPREFDAEGTSGVEIKAEVLDSKKCRACLRDNADEEKQMFCFNSTNLEGGVELSELYKQYIGYNKPNDEPLLPAYICIDCRNALLIFHDFRKKCRSNESVFLDLAKQTGMSRKEDTVLLAKERIDDIDYSSSNDMDEEQSMDFTSAYQEIYETKVFEEKNMANDEVDENMTLKIVYNPMGKTFKCNQCPKMYTKKLYVLNHFRVFHKSSEEDLQKINKAVKYNKTRAKVGERSLEARSSQPKAYQAQSVEPSQPEQMVLSDIYSHKCSQCDKAYQKMNQLALHMRHSHVQTEETEDLIKDLQEQARKAKLQAKVLQPEIYKFKCQQEKCGRLYTTIKHLTAHLRGNHQVSEDVITELKQSHKETMNNIIVAESSQAEQIVLSERNSYKCTQCDKVYQKMKQLASHMRANHVRTKETEDLIKELQEKVRKEKLQAKVLQPEIYKFKCQQEKCGRVYTTIKHLTAHLRGNHQVSEDVITELKQSQKEKMKNMPNISKYECERCDNVFQTIRKFTVHLKSTHNLAEDVIAQLKTSQRKANPGYSQPQPALAQIPQPYRFKCEQPQCGKAYLKNSNLTWHLRYKHKLSEDVIKKLKIKSKNGVHKIKHNGLQVLLTEKNSFKCELCGKLFEVLAYLMVHFRRFHQLGQEERSQLKARVKRPEEVSQIKLPPAAPKPDSICQICGKRVRKIAAHMLMHTENDNTKPYECALCGTKLKRKSYILKHMQISHLGHKYKCSYCSASFLYWSSRRNHIHMKHMQVNPEIKCTVCNKEFTSELTLRLHRSQSHRTSSVQCEICSNLFTNAETLKRHKESKHLGVLYSCELCGKTVSNRRLLKRHIESHAGARNYECPVCLHLFGHNSVMRSHVEKLHPDYQLPPKGTVMHKKALEQMAMKRENDLQFVKIDCKTK